MTGNEGATAGKFNDKWRIVQQLELPRPARQEKMRDASPLTSQYVTLLRLAERYVWRRLWSVVCGPWRSA